MEEAQVITLVAFGLRTGQGRKQAIYSVEKTASKNSKTESARVSRKSSGTQ